MEAHENREDGSGQADSRQGLTSSTCADAAPANSEHTLFSRARDVTPMYMEHDTNLDKSQRNEINVYSETMMELKPEITKKIWRKKTNVRKLNRTSK